MISRKTMTASEMIRVLQESIDRHGDLPVQFSDGFFRYGLTCHAESAPNYNSPRTMLVKAFSLTTGRDGPNTPIDIN